jgi:hypothetical protein
MSNLDFTLVECANIQDFIKDVEKISYNIRDKSHDVEFIQRAKLIDAKIINDDCIYNLQKYNTMCFVNHKQYNFTDSISIISMIESWSVMFEMYV